MFSLGSSHSYYLYGSPVDMRKGFDGLCGLVRNELDREPSSGEVYVFLNSKGNVMPGSAIGKALRYSAERWAELSNYLYDGRLEIDNNLVENAIRPVALGRKKLPVCRFPQRCQKRSHDLFILCHLQKTRSESL